MYAHFFGLQHEPFSIAPDPRYLFMSERHREALAHLLYGVQGGGGFVLLSGEIGAGKTTVCRCFLEQVPPACHVAYIFNPKLTVIELLKTICDEFHIAVPHAGPAAPTVKDYLDPLNARLLAAHAAGQNNVLIIDEAQNLSAEVLEQLRLLTNLETSERKLLQIILIGQPELRGMLARPELEQLAQRVIARYHLESLSPAETQQYIAHRLAVAGLARAMPFDAAALKRIHQITRGVPRRINLLCDRALLGAYAGGRVAVGRAIVEKAAAEVFGPAAERTRSKPPRSTGAGGSALAWGAGGGLLAGAALLLGWQAVSSARHPVAGAVAGPAMATSAASRVSGAGAVAATRLTASASASAFPFASASAPAATRPDPALSTPADLATAFGPPLRDEAAAWRQLAPLWGLPALDGDPCAAALRAQVGCFRARGGNLAFLRQLDRPALLTLRDGQDHAVYALLTALGPDSATLRMGEASRTVAVSTLATLWRGDFATFWRVPPGYTTMLADGSRGPAVEWLAAQLARLRGETPPASAPGRPAVLDAALRAQVFAFQLTQGLSPDGVAGPTTFMQINRASGVAEPRLLAPGK